MAFCKEHKDIPWGNTEARFFVCVVCDQRVTTRYQRTPLICFHCSDKEDICRFCGKELDFDVDDQQ